MFVVVDNDDDSDGDIGDDDEVLRRSDDRYCSRQTTNYCRDGVFGGVAGSRAVHRLSPSHEMISQIELNIYILLCCTQFTRNAQLYKKYLYTRTFTNILARLRLLILTHSSAHKRVYSVYTVKLTYKRWTELKAFANYMHDLYFVGVCSQTNGSVYACMHMHVFTLVSDCIYTLIFDVVTTSRNSTLGRSSLLITYTQSNAYNELIVISSFGAEIIQFI